MGEDKHKQKVWTLIQRALLGAKREREKKKAYCKTAHNPYHQ